MTQSFQQLLVTNYGLLPSGYTGSQGIQGVPGTSDSTPKITAIAVTDSSYTVLDDTAVDVAGGYVQLTGTGFASGCVVMVNNVPATSTTFVSSTQVQAQLPATAAGTYVVYLVNADGAVAIRINGITFSATPAWTTASALPGTADGTAISIQLAATGADTYALAAGSTLPGTLTLTSGGLLSGTVSGLANETTYSFTVVATDAELQDSPRTFSITITAGDPLFAATTLLLPGSATTFVSDASTNNFAVSVAGDTRPNTFNPYLTGWSNYFDGTGDYLTVPDNAALQMGTGNFTIEFWINFSSIASYQSVYDKGYTGAGALIFQTGLGNGRMVIYANGSAAITESGTAPTGTWIHYALVRNGSTLTLYRDGVSSGSATNSTNFNNATNLAIGAGSAAAAGGIGSYPVNGYMSNLRVVKGTAVYTADFTPPTEPLTAIAGTSLLTCQSNRFTDNSVNNFAVTSAGDVKVQSFSPFAEPATTGGSGYFDGTGDFLNSATPLFTSTSRSTFTIEGWIYPTTFATLINVIGDMVTVVGDTKTLAAEVNTSGQVALYWFDGSVRRCTGNTVLTLNAWNYFAIVVNNNAIFIYANKTTADTLSGTTTLTNRTQTTGMGIGAYYNSNAPAQYFTGYLSNLRVSFTNRTISDVPTAPFITDADTRLLTLQNNQPTNNSMFLDSSTNNLLVTRAGNATQGTSSPYSPAGWSNYFDGTGDYLSLPTSAAILGSGNFTIELWVYPQLLANLAIIDTRGASTSTNGWLIHYGSDRVFRLVNDGNNVITTTTTAPLNEWTHIAVCRVGSTVTFYVNGVASGTATNSSAFDPSSLFYIGIKSLSTSANVPFLGYMSNIRLVSGTAVYTSDFAPPTQPLTAIAGTSLLTCADNRFIDDSANNFAITRNGDVRVTNFAPFRAQVQTPMSYSAYFDGSGSYLTAVGSGSVVRSSGSFTIEGWYYPTSSAASFRAVYSGYFTAGSIWQNNTTLTFYWGPSSSLTGSIGWTLNTWNHWAVTWDGTTTRVYVNGQQTISSTSPTYSGTADIIISDFQYPLTGYISNFRVSNSVIYSANFTPPTQPLTAIAGTSLLTCQSPTFIDNSTNNFAITAAGNSQPTTVNPFGSASTNSTGYTASEYSGSMSFDGTGDFLSFPGFFGTRLSGDFTVEAWVNVNNLSNNQAILCIGDSNATVNNLYGGDGFFVYIATDAKISLMYGSQRRLGGTTSVNINSWNHVAWVRRGSTITAYLNGISQGTLTVAATFFGPTVYVGRELFNGSPRAELNGYISDLRIIHGTAVYTSNFVPPIAPVQPVPGTTLLLNGTSAAITDATTRNVLETVGDVRISTAVAKFGGSSMYFDGSDSLNIPSNPQLNLGSGNFTIEMWAYTTNSGNFTLFLKSNSYELKTDSSRWVWQINAATNVFVTNGTLTLNTWTHVALVRNGSTTTLYLNGTSAASGTSANANDNTSTLQLGTGSSAFVGYINDFRITNGHARYTSNFTPPTTAFQTR